MDVTFSNARNHDEYRAALQRLSDLGSTLTEALLEQALHAKYDDGDDNRSIGFDWMTRNPDSFRAVCDAQGMSARAFFEKHKSQLNIAFHILLHAELLKLVPANEREHFVRGMYENRRPYNNCWIRNVREAGIGPATCAELMINELERDEKERKGGDCPSSIRDFLQYGHSEHDSKNAPWVILSKDQLKKAIAICSRNASNLFFEQRWQIEKALGKEHFAALGREVVLRSGMFNTASVTFVQEQPIEFQLKIAQGMVPPEFIIGLIMKLDDAKARELWFNTQGIFARVFLFGLYRKTYETRHPGGLPKHAWLELELEKMLTNQGTIFAVVQEGTFTPRGQTRPVSQFYVERDGQRYVTEKRQYPRPKAGDLVMFRMGDGHRLTPKVSAVTMYPANNDTKVTSN